MLDRYDDIRRFVVLKTIVECGSVQKASRVLKVTPSAVSQSLSTLEKKLETPLFIRERGKIVPTKECLVFLERAEPAFKALEEFLGVKNKDLPHMRSLDFGTYESIAIDILPSLMAKLKNDFPGIRLNVQISRSSLLLSKVRSGELCTAIIVDNGEIEGFKSIEVARARMGLFISSKLCSSNGKATEVPAGLDLGCLSPGRQGHPRFYQRFMSALTDARISMTSDSLEVLKTAAEAGSVAAVLPHHVALRNPGSLVEVTSFAGKPITEKGEHRIVLVSLDRCDADEAEYLANVVRDMLKLN